MANPQFIDVTLYAHWGSALVNNDYSGLDDAEIAELEMYVEDEASQHEQFLCVNKADNDHFGTPEFTGALPGTVATFTFQVAG